MKEDKSCWYYAGREDAEAAAGGDEDIDMTGGHLANDAAALADWRNGVADWQTEQSGRTA